jgi:GTPase SAR1 family protein
MLCEHPWPLSTCRSNMGICSLRSGKWLQLDLRHCTGYDANMPPFLFVTRDLAGQANLRPSWASYYANTNAVIVVADSTDRARTGILRQELFTQLAHESLTKACVLIFANKQDLVRFPELCKFVTCQKFEAALVPSPNPHVPLCCSKGP